MKKKLFVISLLSMLGLGAVMLTSCDLGNNTTKLGDVEIPTTSKKENTFQATTSVSLLNSINKAGALKAHNPLKLSKDFNSQSVQEDLAQVLPQLDLMMDNGFDISSNVEEVTTEIEGKTYAVKETISYKDFNNETVTYSLIYNARSYEERDDDEIERYTYMEGYVLLNDANYEFTSVMKNEQEWDEEEVERNFRINLNNNSYIFVESSMENEGNENEEEYEYTYIENGRKVIEYSIEIEKEGFKDSIEIEYNEKEFEVSRTERDGKILFFVKLKEGRDYRDYLTYEKVIGDDGSVSYILLTNQK